MNNTTLYNNLINFEKLDIESLFNNIPAIAYVQDINSNFLFGNELAKNFIFHKYDAILGKYLNFDNHFLNFFVNQKTEDKIFTDNENSQHWYRIFNFPFKIKNAEYFLVIIKNIDNEIDLQTQKENYVASLCHDLKNPTIAQIKCLEFLINEKAGSFNPLQKELLYMLLDSCNYMKKLLSTTLDTYKNNNGVVKICKKEFSVKNMVTHSISEMLQYAKEKKINILLVSELQSDTILADEIQLKRVILNLLSNSIKFAYTNTDLKIKLYDTKLYFCFELENSSPYIPKNLQKIIFEKYVSFPKNNETGIGLGLYSSKLIINAHGGELYLKSSPKNKNIFGFKIPL